MNRKKCLQESDKRIEEERRVYHLIDTIPTDKPIEITIKLTFRTPGRNAWRNAYTTAVAKVDLFNRTGIRFEFIAIRDPDSCFLKPKDHIKFKDIHSWHFFDTNDLPLLMGWGTKFDAFDTLMKEITYDDSSSTVGQDSKPS